MLPESMLWYLITGKIPTKEEAAQFTSELAERSSIPSHIEKVLDAFRRLSSS